MHSSPDFPAISIYVFLFNYCGERGFYELGRRIQQELLPLSPTAMESPLVQCSLLGFYGWNGEISTAESFLEQLRKQNALKPYMINSMMHTYIFSGMGAKVLELWNKSNLYWTEKTTFLILKAYTIQRETQKMLDLVEEMRKRKIPFLDKHKGVVALALASEGRFLEAETKFGQLVDPNDWYRLLLVAYHHGDIERGCRYFNTILQKDPKFFFAYVVMYSFWNKVNASEKGQAVIDSMLASDVPVQFGVTTVEYDGKARRFRAERLNEIEELEEECRELDERLQKAGWDLEDLEGFSRKMAKAKNLHYLSYSMDKLAVVFLLKHSAPGTKLRLSKARLISLESHHLFGAVSKLTGREILVNDRTKLHHFVNGTCTYCLDSLYFKGQPIHN
uniref:DYW domain-containing protein n=1 Tax=Arcella intermedia TaxID=1963864 RepID=A0A6B2L5Z8_9EUKA